MNSIEVTHSFFESRMMVREDQIEYLRETPGKGTLIKLLSGKGMYVLESMDQITEQFANPPKFTERSQVGEELTKVVINFMLNNRVDCAEDIHQQDSIQEHSLELIEQLYRLVENRLPDGDDEEGSIE